MEDPASECLVGRVHPFEFRPWTGRVVHLNNSDFGAMRIVGDGTCVVAEDDHIRCGCWIQVRRDPQRDLEAGYG